MRSIELDEQTLERVARVARERHCTVNELLSQLLEKLPADASRDPWLGMLADEPELADFIVDSAMTTRETDSLRAPHRG